jgi:hypothetical protein
MKRESISCCQSLPSWSREKGDVCLKKTTRRFLQERSRWITFIPSRNTNPLHASKILKVEGKQREGEKSPSVWKFERKIWK